MIFYLVEELLLTRTDEVDNNVAMDTTSGLAGGYLRVIGVALTHTSLHHLNPIAKRTLVNLRAELYSAGRALSRRR